MMGERIVGKYVYIIMHQFLDLEHSDMISRSIELQQLNFLQKKFLDDQMSQIRCNLYNFFDFMLHSVHLHKGMILTS